MGTGASSDSFTGYWDTTPHTGSSCLALIHGVVLSLTTTWYAMLCWYSGETWPFLNKTDREYIAGWEHRVVGQRGLGEEGGTVPRL